MRRGLRLGAVAVVAVVAGTVLTLTLQSWTVPASRPAPRVAGGAPPLPATHPEAPATFLAWVPGGLPAAFAADVRRLPQIGRVAVVAEDNVWLARSWTDAGELVDHPSGPYRIPIDAAAVDPVTFASFLPPPDRGSLAAVANGRGILGATSASLRGLGPGAMMDFGPGKPIRIAGVVPDELVGAAEILVSTQTGRRIGVVEDRYLLVRPAAGHVLTSSSLAQLLQPILPAELGVYRRVQVRAPGETPYFRAGDAVLPPVLLKTLFGEFAARPEAQRPGYLDIEPGWEQEHLATIRLPGLGEITCHRGIVPQLRGAMEELAAVGLENLIRTYDGCYAPRMIGRDPTAMISHHAWGIAFDVNLVGNLYGDRPHQDRRLVDILERWGFMWGGDFIVPDGNHFEYHRSATA